MIWFFRKGVFTGIALTSILSFGQNQPQSYDSLKHSFLPKYEIYVWYFNPLQISKTILPSFTQREGTFDFLLKNTESPKYQIYFQYFNPFQISKTFYQYDFGFKWKHKSEKFYWRSCVILQGFGFGYNRKFISFAPLARLTLKKVPWIHLELSSGPTFLHRYELYNGIFNTHGFGLGILTYMELQFDVGNRFNISLSTLICPAWDYNFSETNPNYPFSKPNNFYDFGIYTKRGPYPNLNITMYF